MAKNKVTGFSEREGKVLRICLNVQQERLEELLKKGTMVPEMKALIKEIKKLRKKIEKDLNLPN